MHSNPASTNTAELTDREKEILRLVATGTGNKDIAHQLFISSNTVKVHVRNIFAKIGVSSRTEAAMYAVRMGLVNTSSSEGDALAQTQPEPSGSSTIQNVDIEAPSKTSKKRNKLPEFILASLRPIKSIRLAVVAVVIVFLLVVIGMGFLLARQERPLITSITNSTSTPESRWHIQAPLPTAREGMAVTAVENQVYAIGGETALGVTGLVERYDPISDSWEEVAEKPLPVKDAKAAVISGKIYVPGGSTASGAVTDTLEIYDPRQDAWEKGTSLPVAMSAYAMTAFEGRLYLFGGWDGRNYLSSVYIYRPESESWSLGKSMSMARGFAGAAVVGESIFVVGGENAKGKLSINEANDLRLDISDGSDWYIEESLPVSASNIGLINVADLLYAVVSENGLNGIYVYHNKQNTNDKTWEFLPMPFEFGSHFSTIMLGTKLYVMGGNLGGKQLSLNVSYDAIYTIVLPISK